MKIVCSVSASLLQESFYIIQKLQLNFQFKGINNQTSYNHKNELILLKNYSISSVPDTLKGYYEISLEWNFAEWKRVEQKLTDADKKGVPGGLPPG